MYATRYVWHSATIHLQPWSSLVTRDPPQIWHCSPTKSKAAASQCSKLWRSIMWVDERDSCYHYDKPEASSFSDAALPTHRLKIWTTKGNQMSLHREFDFTGCFCSGSEDTKILGGLPQKIVLCRATRKRVPWFRGLFQCEVELKSDVYEVVI